MRRTFVIALLAGLAAGRVTAGDLPRAVVAEGGLELGDAEFGETRTTTARITNDGAAPLKLAVARKSCSCGDAELSASVVPVGGEARVNVRWTPGPGKPGPVTLAVDLATNDPQAPLLELRFTGRVVSQFRFLPEDPAVDFRTLAPKQAAERELRVVSDKLGAFELEASTSSAALKAEVKALTPDPDLDGFRSGFLVRVRAGELPAGPLQETLKLRVRPPGGVARVLEVPVYGEVDNGVFEVRPKEIVFRKKLVTEEDSKRVLVQFFVPSKDEELKVECCEPAFLTCDPPRAVKPGLWEMTVRLPANSPEAAKYQADGLLEGRVLLRTPKSTVPVAVRVKWVGPSKD